MLRCACEVGYLLLEDRGRTRYCWRCLRALVCNAAIVHASSTRFLAHNLTFLRLLPFFATVCPCVWGIAGGGAVYVPLCPWLQAVEGGYAEVALIIAKQAMVEIFKLTVCGLLLDNPVNSGSLGSVLLFAILRRNCWLSFHVERHGDRDPRRRG